MIAFFDWLKTGANWMWVLIFGIFVEQIIVSIIRAWRGK